MEKQKYSLIDSEIGYRLSLLNANLSFRIYLGLFVLANLALWIFIFFIKSRTKEGFVILHYNVNFGVDLIGPASNLFSLPAIGVIIIITNIAALVTVARFKNNNFLIHLLLAVALMVNINLILSSVSLYWANFRI
jgi:hypothetical protein